jgi:hypothetical protein
MESTYAYSMRTLSFLALSLVLAACGSSEEPSTFGAGNPGPSASGGPGGDPGDLGTSGGMSSGSGGGGGTCATVTAKSELTPVNLVVMLDRSGSMGDTLENPAYDPALRWVPVGEGITAFFEDVNSKGMRASLTFFPASGSNTTSCVAGDYARADLTSVELPSPTLGARIAQLAPRGDTPTRPALQGAIAQAQALRAARPNEKTVIVMATDGEPWACGVSDGATRIAAVNAAAMDAAAVATDIKTYVIGVGPSVGLLNQIAVAGGTGAAILVSAGQAEKTKTELLKALGEVRANTISCDVDMPSPPDGRTLDVNKVDVAVSGAALAYSADCSNTAGWHFDDVANPRKVMLCAGSCTGVKTAGGALSVSFACTNVRVIR